MLRTALVQLDIRWEDRAVNHERAGILLAQAAAAGARLAILPEMFATGFSMKGEDVAEEPEGATGTWLKETAAELGLWIIAGVAETGTPLPRNTAHVVSPRGEIVRYAKIHPFSFAEEDKHYAGGNRVVTVPVEGVRVTPFVCYDLRFPEPFRLAAHETDLYVVIANWPERRRTHWQTLLRARAIENLAYVAGVNRVGDGEGYHYCGDSALVSPWGETLAGGAERETVLVADVDPAVVKDARAKFPALRDRRPDAYRR
jgi:predicted amidohydrolase